MAPRTRGYKRPAAPSEDSPTPKRTTLNIRRRNEKTIPDSDEVEPTQDNDPPAGNQRQDEASDAEESDLVDDNDDDVADESSTPNPHSYLNRRDWLNGEPLLAVQLPQDYEPKTTFRVVPVQKLTRAQLLPAVRKWQLDFKNRPDGSKILKAETLQNNKGLLAGYLGFSTLAHLYHFLDFVVPLVAQPLVALFSRYEDAKGKEGSKLPMVRKL